MKTAEEILQKSIGNKYLYCVQKPFTDEYFYPTKAIYKAMESYAQQRVEEATRWIPVSERLPEFNSLCLAFGVGHTPVMCRYTRRFERHIDRVDNDRTLAIYYDQITHWQPLPKAPTV